MKMKRLSFLHTVIPVFKVISFLTVLVSSDLSTKQNRKQPNIIFILADDAGWNDFSFHGSPQIPTPNIDALALNGIVLNSYYVSPLCTPTRAAIVTGKHPIHLGLQHYVIMGASQGGLPLTEKILPQYLKEQGYSTHLVGKWHLGHSSKEFTPTYRGFDTHFGYWLGKQDYYSHISIDGRDENGNGCWGYDFRNNTEIHRSVFGQYDTDLFTDEAIKLIYSQPTEKPLFMMITHIAPHSANSYDPLQAPKENVNKFKATIKDENRQKYAGMVDKLDESVGLIIEALSRKKMLSNSIIVFASDNGGAPEGFDLNYSSNWPLRGTKNTLWEGGTRVAATIWSPLIKSRVSRDIMHAQDWLPTFYEASGGDIRNLRGIDGISMWKTFAEGHPSPRTSFLYNIDDIYNNSAVREGPWKLIQGNTSTNDLGGGVWDFWYGPSGRSSSSGLPSVNLLVPKIASSTAAKAMAYSGIRLNLTRMGEMQTSAEFRCDQSTSKQIPCNPYQTACLFNVEEDPCELYNVADRYPTIVDRLRFLINEHNKSALAPMKRVAHPEAFPRNHGNVWTTWETPGGDDSSGGGHVGSSKPNRTHPGSAGTSKIRLPPTLTTTSLNGNHLDESFKGGRSAGIKNQANGLAVNFWGFSGHNYNHQNLKPFHPSHWAVHNLVASPPPPTTTSSSSASANPYPNLGQTYRKLSNRHNQNYYASRHNHRNRSRHVGSSNYRFNHNDDGDDDDDDHVEGDEEDDDAIPHRDNPGHDHHFRIHRNRVWKSNSHMPIWLNRPFVSESGIGRGRIRL